MISLWWVVVSLTLLLQVKPSEVVALPSPGICTLQNFWNAQKCKSCSFQTGLCTRFNPDVNMSQFYWGQQTCFTYINSDFFSNSFRSRVLFQEHDKTSDLKVHLVISGWYFEILCMHCSYISWNLSCFKPSTAWKTSACMSSVDHTLRSLGEPWLWHDRGGHVHSWVLWFQCSQHILQPVHICHTRVLISLCCKNSPSVKLKPIFSASLGLVMKPQCSPAFSINSTTCFPEVAAAGTGAWWTTHMQGCKIPCTSSGKGRGERFPCSRWWGHCVSRGEHTAANCGI